MSFVNALQKVHYTKNTLPAPSYPPPPPPNLLATFSTYLCSSFCHLICFQTIVYPQVSVWCKQGIFGRKVLLGDVRIALGSLNLSVKQVSWYKLLNDSQLSEWWFICREPKLILWKFFSNWLYMTGPRATKGSVPPNPYFLLLKGESLMLDYNSNHVNF